MLDVVVGLGSNLGDRLVLIRRAAERIGEIAAIRERSALYETAPIGPPQPSFINAALRVDVPLEPAALLDALLDVERRLGRVRAERWGPRRIDLDILWVRGLAHASPRLSVPHPGLRERAFALRPLLDVAPDAADPRDGVRYASVLALLGTAGVAEIPGTRGAWG